MMKHLKKEILVKQHARHYFKKESVIALQLKTLRRKTGFSDKKKKHVNPMMYEDYKNCDK